jgi:hypothetical protein
MQSMLLQIFSRQPFIKLYMLVVCIRMVRSIFVALSLICFYSIILPRVVQALSEVWRRCVYVRTPRRQGLYWTRCKELQGMAE